MRDAGETGWWRYRPRRGALRLSGGPSLALRATAGLGTAVDAEAKRHLYQALALYASSIATARVRQEETDYRLIDLDHAQAMDSAEAAAQMWNALIATPINQLVEYHGSGVKPEQLAQILALLGIAVGVNR